MLENCCIIDIHLNSMVDLKKLTVGIQIGEHVRQNLLYCIV